MFFTVGRPAVMGVLLRISNVTVYAIIVTVHGDGYEVIFLLGNELSGQTGVIRFTESYAIYMHTRLVINLSSVPR